MTTLAHHTLIIPTYNRPEFLHQLVQFYRREAPHMPLLVLDSSAPENAQRNRDAMARFGAGVTYHHYAATIPMAEKLALGLAEVTTPTVSFCADDDVVFPRALEQSVDYLSHAHDVVCSHGLYISFSLFTDQIYIEKEYAGESNEAAHAGARIFRLGQHYESLFYAVFRTPQLRQIFDVVRTLPSLHFQELFQSVGALMLGKVHRFPDLYAARRSGPEAEPGREKWQTYYWFANDATDMLQHYVAYRHHAFDFYQRVKAPELSSADFARAFDLAHAIYFSRGCPPAYFHDQLQALWPEDRFLKAPADLFERLHAAQPSLLTPTVRAWLAQAQKLFANLPKWPLIKQWRTRPLDRFNATLMAAHQSGQHALPWRCHLPVHLLWLGAWQPFHANARTLCRYLDCASPKA
jgi:glycosyltransferase domain-containing protein